MTLADDWFETHRGRLDAAVDARRSRVAFAAFNESPSRRHHPEGAKQRGLEAYHALLGRSFPLDLDGERGRVGGEVSPYTRAPLGVDYPAIDPDAAVDAAAQALPALAALRPRQRVGLCLELLARLEAQLFLSTFATMHTTGQGFMMAFAGSGANSLDRGLEGLAAAWDAMEQVPDEAIFVRRFAGVEARLHKRFHLRPRGVAVVIACGSYPAWNAYPALLANLATGNPVVLKAHPNSTLPMAIAARTAREVLADAGLPVALVTLAADTRAAPLTQRLVLHPQVRIVDFTGGAGFGAWIEANAPRKLIYTETSGCNAVVLDGAASLDDALGAVAESLALFSAQMCTAAQNVYVPATGVRDGGRTVAHDEVVARLVAAVDAAVAEPAHAAGLCGALYDDAVCDTVNAAAALGPVLRASAAYAHPEHPRARTATPLLVALDADARGAAQREHFGPVGFVITARDRAHALGCASEDAARFGSIASYAYTDDAAFADEVERRFVDAGASVGINLLRQRPINFAAAHSDYHVTGLNPAGTATLTDLAFVAERFRVVQAKHELPGG